MFCDSVEQADVLIDGPRIIGVGEYGPADADETHDLDGAFVCPGFIDGHIHIESTLLTPAELARACVPHGTSAIVADPHEIANVCGRPGIEYMLRASEGIPLRTYIMLPSCVPSTPFDESGARLTAADLSPLYGLPRVLGLAEVMSYPDVVVSERGIMEKLGDARRRGMPVDGHAPLLTGRNLDTYIAAGVSSDHECSRFDEALERIRKGQWVMIRQGSAARNLDALLPLFDEPYSRRCLLVTDDRHPADILWEGHIDNIIRLAARAGKSPVTGIRMATLQAAQRFGLQELGAVAPGYLADLLVLDDLYDVRVRDVYHAGKKVVDAGTMVDFPAPRIPAELIRAVRDTVHIDEIRPEDFVVGGSRTLTDDATMHEGPDKHDCRIIRCCKGDLITEECVAEVDLDVADGIDLDRDILKIAVVERHRATGHIGLGYINGLGLKRGAIASTVGHDAHNLIVAGTNERDMAVAANRLREIGGGCTVVDELRVLAEMPLPIGGLMSERHVLEVAAQNKWLNEAAASLCAWDDGAPFMTLAFMSLPVIPALKLTTRGLVDVAKQQVVPLFVD